jgi:hypothetical protein
MKRLIVSMILAIILSLTLVTPAFAYPPPESGQDGLSNALEALESRPPPGYGKAFGWSLGKSVINSIIGGWFPPPYWVRYG